MDELIWNYIEDNNLPPKDADVFVYTIHATYEIWSRTLYTREDRFWEDESGFWKKKTDVIAWLPLPNPPETKERCTL